MDFGGLFGLKDDTFELFDKDRSLLSVGKNVALRAPPAWRACGYHFRLPKDEVAFVLGHTSLVNGLELSHLIC